MEADVESKMAEKQIQRCGRCGADAFAKWLTAAELRAALDAGTMVLYPLGSPAGVGVKRWEGEAPPVLVLVAHESPCGLPCAGGELAADVELDRVHSDDCPCCPGGTSLSGLAR